MWFVRGRDERSEEFDRYLDAMVQQEPFSTGKVDPGLVTATRRVHGLVATNESSCEAMTSVWEEVMATTRATRVTSQPVIGPTSVQMHHVIPTEPGNSSVHWPDLDRRWREGSRLVNAAMLLTVLVVGYVVAQVAFRPPADDPRDLAAVVATPGLAEGQECQVQPRTIGELVSILSTPAASRPIPIPELDAGVAPEVVAAIQATQHEWNACVRAGDVLRQSALETDDHLRQSPWMDMWVGLDPDEIRMAVEVEATRVAERAAATPVGTPAPGDVPPGAEVLVIYDEDVRQLPDGRVGALLREENPAGGITSPLPFNTFRIFVRVGDRWLIDQDIFAGG